MINFTTWCEADYMAAMNPLFLIVTFLLRTIATGHKGQSLVIHYLPLENKFITSAVSISTKNRAADCAKQCVNSDTCESFFYNNVTGDCQLHSALFITPDTATDMKGFQYYYVMKGHHDWCPAEKSFQLLDDGKTCVKIHFDTKTWYDANQTCVSYSPHCRLVVLDTQEKNTLVVAAGMVVEDQFDRGIWTGLTESSQNAYRWVDGQDPDFTHWGPVDESDLSYIDCAFLRRASGWTWTPSACIKPRHYICEINVNLDLYHEMMTIT